MTLDVAKLNLFSPAMKGLQGVNPQEQKPVEGVRPVSGGQNPFAQKSEGVGVGLVNSDLANMSYTLPNGKISKCNTIGIA